MKLKDRMQRRGLLGLLYLLMAAVLVLQQAGAVSAWPVGSPVLAWDTFLGSGDVDDYGYAVAMDDDGNVYVAGASDGSWGSPLQAYNAGGDVFVAKLSSSGGDIIWSTFLGGSGSDEGHAIAVDASGNVYVAGNSYTTWGAPLRAFNGSSYSDVFVAKLDGSGGLLWNTFLGGSGWDDEGSDIAVDDSGNIYVGGSSGSTWGSPVRAYGWCYDAFAAKLSSGGDLTWNTFLGGSGCEHSHDIALDGVGNIYITGSSDTTWGTPVQAYGGGIYDAFAAQINSSDGSLIWHTFLGGSGREFGSGIAVDGGGNVSVTGSSDATWGTPVRAYSSGSFDVFAAKLHSSDGSLIWNTFLGSSGDDNGDCGIAIDGGGNIYVGGTSAATWGSPVQAYLGGEDAFAAKLSNSGDLIWNTFLTKGSSDEFGYAITVDNSGNVSVAGISDAESASGNGSVARTSGPESEIRSLLDAYVAKIDSEHFTEMNPLATAAGGGIAPWAWIIIGFVVILALILIIRLVMRKRATAGGASQVVSEKK